MSSAKTRVVGWGPFRVHGETLRVREAERQAERLVAWATQVSGSKTAEPQSKTDAQAAAQEAVQRVQVLADAAAEEFASVMQTAFRMREEAGVGLAGRSGVPQETAAPEAQTSAATRPSRETAEAGNERDAAEAPQAAHREHDAPVSPAARHGASGGSPRPEELGALRIPLATLEVSQPGSHSGVGPLRPRDPAEPHLSPSRSESSPRGEVRPQIGSGAPRGEDELSLDSTLRTMIDIGASDLHITTGVPPMARVDGRLTALEGYPTLYPDQIQGALYAILTQRQREEFEANLELNFAYAVRGAARFRVNLYQQRDSLGAEFHVIPYEIRPLEELGVPPVVANFAGLPHGLVLVTGPTGSGKSTTLAAIIDLANRTRSDHIMTVEDPIEFLHRHKKAVINQREVGTDTLSFANALQHVLRQDPDIILIGELRDLPSISDALGAAETGHLVFGTLHTRGAVETVERIIDAFPVDQQHQIRTQLAAALQGVISQTLCRRASGRGRVVATEVMVATPTIRSLIREEKAEQIYSAMQVGARSGMHTMDQHLAELVRASQITYEEGLQKCRRVDDYNRLVGRSSPSTRGSTTTELDRPPTGGQEPSSRVPVSTEPSTRPVTRPEPPPVALPARSEEPRTPIWRRRRHAS